MNIYVKEKYIFHASKFQEPYIGKNVKISPCEAISQASTELLITEHTWKQGCKKVSIQLPVLFFCEIIYQDIF